MTVEGMLHHLMVGPFSMIWPMLLVPWLANLLTDRTASLLPETRADWRMAAALSSTPGLAMLSLALAAIVFGLFHLHWHGWSHAMRYQGASALGGLIISYGCLRISMRNRVHRQLVGLAKPPSKRLRSVSAALGVDVRELPTSRCECFVAGVRRPRIYVSTGMLARVSDSELRAALCHERAHLVGRDPAMLTILAFLRDIAPGRNRAFDAFVDSRERAADARAVSEAGRESLASALVTLTKHAQRNDHILAMASSPSALWRLHAILMDEKPARLGRLSQLVMATGLTVGLCMSGWPYFQLLLIRHYFCGCHA